MFILCDDLSLKTDRAVSSREGERRVDVLTQVKERPFNSSYLSLYLVLELVSWFGDSCRVFLGNISRRI